MNLPQDKRKWLRVEKRLPIEISFTEPPKKGGRFKMDAVWTKDVGGNGVGLVTSIRCKVGLKVQLKFSLPEQKNPIQAKGTVVWSQLSSTSGFNNQYQVGVCFDSIEEADRQTVMRFVAMEAGKISGKQPTSG